MDRNMYQNDEFARTLHDEALTVHGTDAIDGDRQPYGPPGFHGLFSNYYATLCAAFAAIGRMVFGYYQGVFSVILVMPNFLDRCERVSETASGAGF